MDGDLSRETDESDAVLKFINRILMEEALDTNPNISHDASSLQAFEMSFYKALGQNFPPSPHQLPSESGGDDVNPVSSITSQSSDNSLKGPTTVPRSDDFNWSHAENLILDPCSQSYIWSPSSGRSGRETVYGPCDSSINMLPVSGLLSCCDSSSKCRPGLEEASHISINQMIADLGNAEVSLPSASNEDGLEKFGAKHSSNASRGRKNRQRDNIDYVEEERSHKHSAVYVVETELSEIFEKVMLCDKGSSEAETCKELHQREEQVKECSSRITKDKKQDNHNGERIDLTTLLAQCAQAVSTHDHANAWKLLDQIRQQSSPSGDASQRLLHCFANGLEARLAGFREQSYAGCVSRSINGIPAFDIMKVYHAYISFCPFMRASFLFANQTIKNLSKKETTLHIIDFGIEYGFQWPVFMQCISRRPGGPPKVCITGIDLPQAGLHPSEKVEETGRRLSYYCRRFNIPFEYYPIAKRFETIRREDLTLHEGDFVAVNCLYRFGQLLDETVLPSCPRDAVFDLIRSINPNVFIHGVVNGNYSAPFFVTRFREALFHFSALFDMLEACLPREDEARMVLETVIYGNEAMNVIACEGRERFERPETYKQWHVRHRRTGFRGIPLNQDLLKEIKAIVKLDYHKDFMVDDDNHWMLVGWKGRITHALSCWKPS